MDVNKTSKVAQTDFLKQQVVNEEVNKRKVQEKDKTPDAKKLESNPAAFKPENPSKVLDKAESKAEANKVDMSETKKTLGDIFRMFKGSKASDLDTQAKKSLQPVKVEPDRKVEVPKLKDSNKDNTGADLMVKAVKKDEDNVMENLANLQAAKLAQQNSNNLQEQNKQLQTQVV